MGNELSSPKSEQALVAVIEEYGIYDNLLVLARMLASANSHGNKLEEYKIHSAAKILENVASMFEPLPE